MEKIETKECKKIVHFIFALKPSAEFSCFSFVLLANSLQSAKNAYLQNIQEMRKILVSKELVEYDAFITSCSIYCLGSIDYVSGELVSNVENTNVKLAEELYNLEVQKDA